MLCKILLWFPSKSIAHWFNVHTATVTVRPMPERCAGFDVILPQTIRERSLTETLIERQLGEKIPESSISEEDLGVNEPPHRFKRLLAPILSRLSGGSVRKTIARRVSTYDFFFFFPISSVRWFNKIAVAKICVFSCTRAPGTCSTKSVALFKRVKTCSLLLSHEFPMIFSRRCKHHIFACNKKNFTIKYRQYQ